MECDSIKFLNFFYFFFEQAKMELYYDTDSSSQAQGVPKRPLQIYKREQCQKEKKPPWLANTSTRLLSS